MELSELTDCAEDVAAGFRTLREPLPQHATEITSLIADLYAISTALKSLEELTKSRLYRNKVEVSKPDLELVVTSLDYTLEDIVDFFDDDELRKGASREVFKRTWLDMCSFFKEESQDTLRTRLALYKTFLNELVDVIKDKSSATPLMSTIRRNIKSLLLRQGKKPAPNVKFTVEVTSPPSRRHSAEQTSPVSDRRTPRRRSYERTRPHLSPLSPQSSLSPSSGTSSDIPPWAPDTPSSPFTGSTTSSNALLRDHWVRRAFITEHSSTPIPYVGESSKCVGDLVPGVKGWLREQGFEELVQLTFPDSDFRVNFYLREDDFRARIVCKSSYVNRPSDYFCLPLNLLEVVRVNNCLRLCRRRHSGQELVVWANLKFEAIEQMVVFFCTFLALRSQDVGRPIESIRDYELQGEVELYGGQIIEHNFIHALRIYRDSLSRVVRLQASIHKGEMDRSPVWTAFITSDIGTRGWMRLVDQNVVMLRRLRPSIFMSPSDYIPPQTVKGGFVLTFTSRSDAQAFMRVITEIARSR